MKTKQTLITQDVSAYFDALVNHINQLDNLQVTTRQGKTLHKAEIHLLVQIKEHPERNMSELARQADVTRGFVSQQANKLEEQGLIEKRPSPKNNRDTVLVPTAEGVAIVALHDQHHRRINHTFQQYFNGLSATQIATISDFLSVSNDFLQQLIDHPLPKGEQDESDQ